MRIQLFYFRKKRKTDDFIRIIKNDMYLMVNKNNKNNVTTIVPPKIVIFINIIMIKIMRRMLYIMKLVINIRIKNENGNSQKFNEYKEN